MVRSKSQWRFMEMLKHNPEKMKNKPEGLSKAKASEFISSTKTPYNKLPDKVKKK